MLQVLVAAYLNPLYLVTAMKHHGSLLHQFIWWGVNDRYRGSALGMLWTIIVPLLQLAVYTWCFPFFWAAKRWYGGWIRILPWEDDFLRIYSV
ncbi:MAG: hypothetical protein R2875_06020 [Desulfobacterales bacterium]